MNAVTQSDTSLHTARLSLASAWWFVAAALAVLVLIPVGATFSLSVTPAADVWQHLWDNVLPDVLTNTLWLVIGVGLGAATLGVSLAWLTAACDFPGRKWLSWALLLPLAVPAYVLAFVFVGLFDYTGPLQTYARALIGDLPFPPIRSTGGVILVMTLAFYPYVYLITRNAFLTQGRRALEAAQSLGLSPRQAFLRVVLPMARPWIAGSVMLVLMETVADFGTVAVFNYDTFTTAIYKAWYALFSLPAAAQLASLLVLLVFALLLLEQYTRARKRYTPAGRSGFHSAPLVLSGAKRWFASFYCSIILALAFVVPVVQLLVWAVDTAANDLDARYFEFVWHSLLLGATAAAITCCAALLLSYAGRYEPSRMTQALIRLSTLGYALPGPVLAVGTFIPIAWLDRTLSEVLHKDGQFLQGTLLAMLVAYCVRFLAVGFQPIDGNMQRVTRNIDDAARGMGASQRELFQRIHFPILRGGLFTGITLVFVDVMKEMPITLMTRPFGWDTLAVQIFELTSEGQWERAALPAVTLVVAGLIPIGLLSRFGGENHANEHQP